MNKKDKVQIGIVICSVFLILVSVLGYAYAYFQPIITGNEEAEKTVVTTGKMEITFEDGAEVSADNFAPGDSITKTFQVTNTGTFDEYYKVSLVEIINQFNKKDELVYTLKSTEADIDVTVPFPSTTSYITDTVLLKPEEVHHYTLTLTFSDVEENEITNMGKMASGKIQIVDIETPEVLAADTSNASAPELNNNMIAVTHDGTDWVKADTTKAWYNYDAQMWANAVSVTSSSRANYEAAAAGTKINAEDILFMWVWIPRYEYNTKSLGTTYAGGTKALPGTIDVKFIGKDVTTPSSEDYAIHDAFWWDVNDDGTKDANEQLAGIWISKFELSADETCTPNNYVAATGCDITTMPVKSIPNVTSWRGARVGTFWTAIHDQMNGETGTTTYGLTNSDTHMMKNMEYGAAAYLSQSKYGKVANTSFTAENKEIFYNNTSTYMTGCSNGNTTTTASAVCAYSYDVPMSGTGASSTGNIYGVYDMNGGSYEFVMGMMKESTNTEPAVGYSTSDYYTSGWNGKVYNGSAYTAGVYGNLTDIGSRYYDVYDYATSNSFDTRYHTGDATFETTGWYNDSTAYIYSSNVFFYRTTTFGTAANYGSSMTQVSTRAVSVLIG